jgi:hypothetical protein
MAYRLGQFECAACGRLELAAAPAAVAESPRPPTSNSVSSNWYPGAQYRQAPVPLDDGALTASGSSSTRSNRSQDSESGWSSRKWWGINILIIGALGFVLPAMGLQFIILSLFAPFEFLAAGAFVVIGGVLLASESG